VRIYISGGSVDVVEINGDVSLEGYTASDDSLTVEINGVPAFRVAYQADGTWSVTAVGPVPGIETVVYHPAADPEDTGEPRYHPAAPVSFLVAGYSQVAEVVGDFTSVKCGDNEWPTP